MFRAKSYFKFFLKITILNFLTRIFLFIFGRDPERENWEKKWLFVYLEAIGDTIVLTSVLKHYKRVFPNRTFYLLLSDKVALDRELKQFVHEIIPLRYGSFVRNPLYAVSFLNHLRGIGFEKVINHDHSAAEIIGKFISVSLGAREVVGYEGFGLTFEKPFDVNMAKNVAFVERHFYPRFTHLIPSIDRGQPTKPHIVHIIKHLQVIYETLSGRREQDYSTTISVKPEARSRIEVFLRANNLKPFGFAVLNLGSSQSWKNWPVGRFLKVSEVFARHNLPVVLIGSRGEEALARHFREGYAWRSLEMVGKFTVSETIALVGLSRLVFSNDTSPIHMAVALRRPSLAVLGGGHFGKISLYGYPDINKWVYADSPCRADNWRCASALSKGAIAPCIEAVSIEAVTQELTNLLGYIERQEKYPREQFQISYLDSK